MKIGEFLSQVAHHVSEGYKIGERRKDVYVMVDGNQFDIKDVREDGDTIRIYLVE